MPRPARARTTALALALLLTAALAGCTSSPVGRTVQRSSSTSARSSPAAPAPAASPARTAAAAATPVDLSCKKLVPKGALQQLADGFHAVKGYSPPAGSDAAHVAELRGTVCAWATGSGGTLVVAVAKPAKHDLTALKDAFVESSNAVPTYGEEAYFEVVKKHGLVEAFHGRYWIAADSTTFFEPGDASGVVASADAVVDGKSPPDFGQPSTSATERAPTDAATPSASPSPSPSAS